MAHSAEQPPASSRHSGSGIHALPITLALWQLRQTWRLLLVTGLGVIAAVIVICAVPLYSQISETAELQNALNADSATTNYLLVQSSAQQILPLDIQRMQDSLNKEFQNKLGPFLKGPVQFSTEIDNLYIFTRHLGPKNQVSYSPTGNLINIIGDSLSQAAPHLDLLQGRLPQANNNALEIAIMPGTARSLGLKPGSVIAVQIAFDDQTGQQIVAPYLDLLVVGIFQPRSDPFWHDQDFDCSRISPRNGLCGALVSNDAFINALDQLSSTVSGRPYFETPPSLLWYYQLDIAHINVENLSTVQAGLNRIAADIPQFSDPPYIAQTTLTDSIYDVLGQYSNRNEVVQIPIVSLSLLVVGLTLFFVVTMTDILVDRQSETLAVLRSRGASRLQIFGALLIQNAGLCLIALILGPLAAILVVPVFSLATLPRADTGAVGVITTDPLATVQVILVPTLVTIGAALCTMAVAAGGAVQHGILSLRREYARSTYRPLWQRLNIDIGAAIIALVGFGFSMYETSPGVLDERVRVLLLPPLTLAGVVSLLIGLSLLLLRAFPLILSGGTKLAIRNRGATSMLAVAQMARAPRQSLRMTILLAFSVAFAIFALVFNASQTQRILDVANYQVGADFSGQVSSAANPVTPSMYSHIPGVLSATVGYTSFPTVTQGEQSYSVQLLAVDAATFANTFIWTGQDSAQPIGPLMRKLVAQRTQAQKTTIIPAIVDSAAWTTLDLSPGSIFSLSDANGSVSCRVVAEVERIPTVNDSALATGTNGFSASGGILVDYQSYAVASQKVNGYMPTPNNVWLKTRSDPSSLTRVRNTLTKGPLALSDLNDRRAMIDNMSNDPLYLDLTGLLIIGTIMAILLALVGNLVASWLSVRNRLTSFAVLRALGTDPKQLAGILIWEQGIVYTTALIIGIIFGMLLSALALPSLVFTNVAVSGFNGSITSGQYYILQAVPPIEIIIPPSLWIVFIAIITICITALGTMVRVVARPSVSQALRLNED